MNPSLNGNIAVIGVPMDLGADRRGVDMGPSAIRYAGMQQRLEKLGYTVHDEGDLVVKRPKQYATPGTHLKYLEEISRVNEELRDAVSAQIAKGYFPLVIGGDHSIAMGTLGGVLQHKEKPGVIWIDAHADINTDETSPSGNIHGMPLAVSLGIGHPRLTGVRRQRNAIPADKVVIIGARCLDPGERKFLKEKGIKVFTMHEIDRLGMAMVMDEALDIVSKGTDGVHLSLDLDAIDPHDAPGVGTPVMGGITYREGNLAMEMLAEKGILTSAEFVEVNPILDEMNRTAKVAVELMGSVFGEKLL